MTDTSIRTTRRAKRDIGTLCLVDELKLIPIGLLVILLVVGIVVFVVTLGLALGLLLWYFLGTAIVFALLITFAVLGVSWAVGRALWEEGRVNIPGGSAAILDTPHPVCPFLMGGR